MTLHCQSPLRSYLALPSLFLPSHTLFSLLKSDIYAYLYLATVLVTNISNQLGFLQFSSHMTVLQFFMLFRSPFLLKPLSQYLNTPDSPSASQITSHSHLLFLFSHQPFKYCIFLFLLTKTCSFLTPSFPK